MKKSRVVARPVSVKNVIFMEFFKNKHLYSKIKTINDMKTVKITFILLFAATAALFPCSGQNNRQNINTNTMIEKTAIIGHWRIDEIIGLELIGE